MPNRIPGIDHPVIAVADMDAARAVYERLGFTVPPRGSHLQWGTGNWCIMFDRDYLELRGILDSSKYTHGLDVILKTHGEGLMGLALVSEDAQRTHRVLTERGLDPQPVHSLTRNFELSEGDVQPRFSLCTIDDGEAPGLMSAVFCQHLTPELLRRPQWLIHSNGAIGVTAITGIVADIDAAESAHRRLFTSDAVEREGDVLIIRFPSGQSIELMTAAVLKDLRPHLRPSVKGDFDGLVSVTLKTAEINQTESFLGSRGIRLNHAADRVWIESAEACGVVIEFAEHSLS